MNKYNTGFTLIELMIAIVLGLLVSAAAMQLLWTGQRTLMVQTGSSDVQDAASFGFKRMLDSVQLANLGANITTPTDITADQLGGGVVFKDANIINAISTTAINSKIYTQSELTKDNTSINSDQLTIQYQVPQVVLTGADPIRTCEGDEVKVKVGSSTLSLIDALKAKLAAHNPLPDVLVTERYFLRLDAQGSTENYPAYALACKAVVIDRGGTYYYDTNNAKQVKVVDTIAGLNADGEMIVPRVDHFHFLLGVLAKDSAGSTGKPSINYMTVKDYMGTKGSSGTLPVVSIQLSLLVRSQQTSGTSQTDLASIDMLDQKGITSNPATSGSPHYVRQVYTRTIALNNGRAS